MEVPDHMAVVGQILRATSYEPRKLLAGHFNPAESVAPVPSPIPRQVLFPIENAWVDGERRLAVKAEGRTVEELEVLLMRWRFRPAYAEVGLR
jgi:hypothetical protein